MIIQPEAFNAISIKFDDGTTIRLHHSLLGNTDYLYIQGDALTVDKSKGLTWEPVLTQEHMVRISSHP
jgi:hypothetical protein